MKNLIKSVITKKVIKSTLIKLGIAFLIFGCEPVEISKPVCTIEVQDCLINLDSTEVTKTDLVITGEIRKHLCI